MKKNILWGLLLVTVFAWGQAPLEVNPMEMSGKEVKARGLKGMVSKEAHYHGEEAPDMFTVTRVFFDQKGELRRRESHEYWDGQLFEGEDEDFSYRYLGDSIAEIGLKAYKFFPQYTKTSTYEAGRLKETVEERLQYKNQYREYTYDEQGRILQVAYSTMYTAIEKYFYEEDRLMKTMYYWREKDSIPKTETFYQYSETGKIQQKLEINTADQDTLILVQYDEEERIAFYLKQVKSGPLGYSQEGSFDYEEYYFYDAEGRIKQLKYLAPQFMAPDIPRDSLIWHYAHYQFSGDLLMSFDSAGVHHDIDYDAQKNVSKIVGLEMPGKDTVIIEHRSYDENNDLVEVMRWDHLTGKNSKWLYVYEDGNCISEKYLLYVMDRNCVIKRDYNAANRHLRSQEYCRDNRRDLSKDTPGEILESFFDANGNKTYHIRKYGRSDGSFSTSSIDSMVYREGRLEELIEVDLGGYGENLLNDYRYDEQGLLQEILSTYGKDTMEIRAFDYENGKLKSQDWQVFDSHNQKNYVRYHYQLTYNEAEQLVLKKTRKVTPWPYEEHDKEVHFEYNQDGLLQKESGPSSDLRGASVWRKTYDYFYF